MKIEVMSLTEEESERRDYRQAMAIDIDGKREFEVYDGEPEDANLSRDFSDVWKIPNLMEKAYEAGKNGEKFSIENIESEEI